MGLFQNVKQTLSGIIYTLIADSNGNLVGQNGVGNALNVFQTNASMTPATTGSVLTQIGITTASQTLLAANPIRRGLSFYNDSSNFVYVSMGPVAATGAFSLAVQPNGYEELQPQLLPYTGDVSFIGSASGGTLQVTEFTT